MKNSQENEVLDIGYSNKEFQTSIQSYLLRGAKELREKINLTEKSFNFMSRAFNSRGRKHFIYEALNEIEQLAIALMDFSESLAEEPQPQKKDDDEARILRNTLEFLEREISLQTRRLIELLVFLINFSQTNTNEYFDHYLLYQELHQRKKRNRDYKVYYGSENLNNNAVIDLIKQCITSGETKIDLNKCWYLAGNSPKPDGNSNLENFDTCFKKAIGLATESEKIALRFTYNQSYGVSSQSIHLGIGRIKSQISFEGLRASAFSLYKLGTHCLFRCRTLLGLKNRIGVLPKMLKAERDADKMMKQMYNRYVKPEIKKGDFVRVGDSLFEVLGSVRGEFGYRSFKLKFLTRPNIPEIPIEWFPAYEVIKIEDGKKMRDRVIDLLTINGEKPIIDPRILRRSMRESVTKTWTELIEALRNQSTNYKS